MAHEMMLVHTGVTGAETWQCRECERRFIILSWKPWKRKMLDAGDDVPHSGAVTPDGLELSIGAEPVDDDPAPEWWPW